MLCPYCSFENPDTSQSCQQCGASLISPQLEPGSRLCGKYEIKGLLGQGGFGITYAAMDIELGFQVAIKEFFPDGSTRLHGQVIPPAGLDFTKARAQFLEEARVAQRFTHSGIVRVYGSLQANNTAYIVMEALEGHTLAAHLSANGPFAEPTVLEMGKQLCEALEVIHGAGLLHRDIKPENVFLSDDGRAILIDFGSARAFERGRLQRHTRLVTPGYAAPEQYASQAMVGAYTDVYGLSATLYHAVEGVMPPAATERMLEDRLEFHRANALRDALERGLQVKIASRPATARAMSELLLLSRAIKRPPGPAKKSPAVINTSQPRVIGNWTLASDRLFDASSSMSYASLVSVNVEPFQVSVGGFSDSGWHLLILGTTTVVLALPPRLASDTAAFLMVIAAAIGLTGIGQIIRAARQRQVLTRYRVWVRTTAGSEPLQEFDNDSDAMTLARAVRDTAKIPLYQP